VHFVFSLIFLSFRSEAVDFYRLFIYFFVILCYNKNIMKHLIHKRISIFSLVAFIAVLAFSVCAFSLPNKLTAKAASYQYFDEISAILPTENGLIIADENELKLLSSDNEKTISLASVTSLSQSSDTIFALADGQIYSLDFEGSSFASVAYDSSFNPLFMIATNAALYAASENEIRAYSYSDFSFVSYPKTGKINGLTALDNEALYSVQNGYRSSVYKIADDALVLDRLPFYLGLNSDGENLYALNRSGTLLSLSSMDTKELLNESVFVTAYYPTLDGVYYATDRGEVFVQKNGENTLLYASDSAEQGFYSSPINATTRFSKAYICDYLNDRVAVINSDDVTYFSFARPLSTTVNNDGTLLVAHSQKTISTVKKDETTEVFFTAHAPISALTSDNQNALYAIIGGKICSVTKLGSTEIAPASTIFTSLDGSSVYYAYESTVYDLDMNAVFSASSDIISACVDGNGNFFYLTSSALIKRANDGTESEVSGFTGGKHISISRANTQLCAYGDLIIVDDETSKVYSIKSSEAGVTLPAVDLVTTPFDSENIIRTTLTDCAIYSSPLETETIINLSAGAKVIVTKYDIQSTKGISYCYYEDAISKKLYKGYIFKSNLSSPLTYYAPPASVGTLFLNSANLYELPSIYSNKVLENMSKGTELTLLNFTHYESGDGKWYKVTAPSGETGYVLASTVSVRGFIPDGQRPQYNGEIVAHKGAVAAQVYQKIDGQFVKTENEFLLVGTKIEVVEPFDSSEKFTQVIFYDEELGACTAWVETIYVDYNGFSMVQVVAIALIVVTVILLGVLLIRIYQKRRKL
jgi:hypothetical protein